MAQKDELYNELKKLSKRANQRILRLERLTKMKEPFAVKELMDYLSSKPVQGMTKKGRVRVSKSMTETQLIATIKATKEFLIDQYSTVTEAKKLKAEIEKSLEMKLKWKEISTMYQAKELWKFVKDTYGSGFWKDFAPLIFEMPKNEWVEMLESYTEMNDIGIRKKLKAIYEYIKKRGIKGVI